MNGAGENRIVIHNLPYFIKKAFNLQMSRYISMQVGSERLEEGQGGPRAEDSQE